MINQNLGISWVGKKIADRFDVIKAISNNGMGVVFLAFDNNLQKNVILKTPLIKDSSIKSEITERFIREVYALTTLEHPFIVPSFMRAFIKIILLRFPDISTAVIFAIRSIMQLLTTRP